MEDKTGVLTVVGGCFAVMLGACSGVWVHYVPADQLQKEVTPATSTFEGYQLEGGAWVSGRPILVNRDFDFGSAMSIEDIGPAIAAGKRISGNQEVADRLSRLPPMDLNGAFEKQVTACGRDCGELNGKRVRLFGLLYGENQARLQVVLEIEPGGQPAQPARTANQRAIERFVWVSSARPLEGPESWLRDDGAAIKATAEASLPLLLQLFRGYRRHLQKQPVGPAKDVGCAVGGNERASGRVLGREGRDVVLLHKKMPTTILACEESTPGAGSLNSVWYDQTQTDQHALASSDYSSNFAAMEAVAWMTWRAKGRFRSSTRSGAAAQW